MKEYTITELSRLSGLSRKEVKKHLIAQTLRNYSSSNGYKVDEKELKNWLAEKSQYILDDLDSIFNCVDSSYTQESDEYIEKSISSYKKSDNWLTNRLNGVKFADFFCGAGGLSLGLVFAGFEPVLGIEIDKEAYQTYKNNLGRRFHKINLFNALDITSQETKDIIINYLKKEKVNLISGGFPCQGFSLSGSRVISDPRNTLYSDMLDIVKEVKPDYIIMENVSGLMTIFEGKVLKKILQDYRSIGYKLSYKELNAADYGVAQTRKRIFFIGNRINKNNIYPSKLIKNPNNYITCGEVLEKYKDLPERPDINHVFSKHSPEMKKRLLEVPIGESLYSNYNDSWKKCPKDKPSCTIKGNHGATNIHYELPRVITPREMAALQSFPDDYIFYGTKHSQLIQIGNAVPPYVARAIGLALKEEILK